MLIGLPLILWLLLGVFFAGQTDPAQAQEGKRVTATGTARIEGGNTMAAREAALQDAMRRAVEEGLGTLVESRTVVENFALLNDRIYSRSQGFVSGYEVLSENEQRGSYVVAIEATVNLSKLGGDLRAIGILQDMVGKPKMMIMVDEFWWEPGVPRERQTPVDDPASAARIAERFLERGFALVDMAMVQQLRGQEMMLLDDLMESGDALTDLAKRAAADYGAEVLVIGTCKAEPVSSAGGKYTANATFSCKIVDASTGALMGTKQYAQSGAGTSPEGARSASAQRAGDGVAEVLINQVLQFWQNKANTGLDFVIKLYNVESFVRQGMRFIKTIKSMGGVTHAKKRHWDEKLGRLEVDLTYRGGDGDDLTYAIVEAVMDLPGFENIDLRESKGNNLNFYLK